MNGFTIILYIYGELRNGCELIHYEVTIEYVINLEMEALTATTSLHYVALCISIEHASEIE